MKIFSLPFTSSAFKVRYENKKTLITLSIFIQKLLNKINSLILIIYKELL